MQEIKCPKCGEVFTIDEAGYAAIVKQVRDREFSREVQAQTDSAVRLAEAEKDRKIAQLTEKLSAAETEKKLAVQEALGQKDEERFAREREILELESQIERLKSDFALQ